MPTTCVVIGCYNCQRKGVNRGFYKIPKDLERRCRWLAFINRRSENGKPWIPGNAGLVWHSQTHGGNSGASAPPFPPSKLARAYNGSD